MSSRVTALSHLPFLHQIIGMSLALQQSGSRAVLHCAECVRNLALIEARRAASTFEHRARGSGDDGARARRSEGGSSREGGGGGGAGHSSRFAEQTRGGAGRAPAPSSLKKDWGARPGPSLTSRPAAGGAGRPGPPPAAATAGKQFAKAVDTKTKYKEKDSDKSKAAESVNVNFGQGTALAAFLSKTKSKAAPSPPPVANAGGSARTTLQSQHGRAVRAPLGSARSPAAAAKARSPPSRFRGRPRRTVEISATTSVNALARILGMKLRGWRYTCLCVCARC